jgi:hypothetical protein
LGKVVGNTVALTAALVRQLLLNPTGPIFTPDLSE